MCEGSGFSCTAPVFCWTNTSEYPSRVTAHRPLDSPWAIRQYIQAVYLARISRSYLSFSSAHLKRQFQEILGFMLCSWEFILLRHLCHSIHFVYRHQQHQPTVCRYYLGHSWRPHSCDLFMTFSEKFNLRKSFFRRRNGCHDLQITTNPILHSFALYKHIK